MVGAGTGGWPRPLGLEGIEAIVFRTVGDQPSLFESVLPAELLRLPEELARVDALLDDPVFFAPFVPFFDPRIGRPSTPMETYLRLMFLKFRYRLGYETLCREVSDSITWRRFCRIPLEGSVPHPTTLMKLTTRCGSAAVDGLNEALLAKAAEAKLLRTNRVRADTTVVPGQRVLPDRLGAAGQGDPPDRGHRQADPGRRRGDPHQGPGPVPGGRASGRTRSARSCGPAAPPARTRRRPRCGGSPGSWPTWPRPPPRTPNGCWPTPSGRCAGPGPRPSSSRPTASDDAAAVDAADGWPARSTTSTELVAATRQIAAQTRQRLAGHDTGRGDPAGQPARPRRPPDRQGPARQAGRVRPQGPARRQRRRRRPRPHRRAGQPGRRAAARPRGRTDHPAHRPHAAHRHRRPRLRRAEASTTTCTTSACGPS